MATVKIGERMKVIPDSMLEHLAYMHGAIDPDSGHLVCHHYPMGLTLVEVDGEAAPALSIGECIYSVPAPWSHLLVKHASKARLVEVGEEYTFVGDSRVDTSSIALVFSMLRDEKAAIETYSLVVDIHGKGESRSVLVLYKPSSGDEWAIIVTSCKSQEPRDGDLYV